MIDYRPRIHFSPALRALFDFFWISRAFFAQNSPPSAFVQVLSWFCTGFVHIEN
jgi:hypothetical protein